MNSKDTRRNRARKIGAALVSAASVSGCTVGPTYQRPNVPTPSAWTPSASTQPSVVDSSSPPLAWWATLGDAPLESLVQRAGRQNLNIGVATARIREARARRGIAAGALAPGVAAGGRIDHYHAAGPLFPAKTNGYDFYTAGFDAVWELDLFGGIHRSVEAAQADLEAEQDSKRGVLVSVVAEVVRNYVELRTAQQREIIARANIQIQRETLGTAERLSAAGIVGDFDVTRARAELTRTESDVPTFEIQEKTAIHQLGILLGDSPESLASELQSPGPIPSPPGRVPIGLPSELLRRRPDVRRAERQLAAATARIGVAEADLYPQVTLTGDFGVGSEQLSGLFNWSSRYVGVGPAVRWQLFQGGRIRANVEAHEAITQELQDQYKLTILTALGEAADAIVSFNRRQEQLDRLGQSVEASRDSVSIASERYAGGTIDYLSLLDVQRSLLRAQDGATVSQGEVTQSMIALYKAIGGGWEKIEQDERAAATGPRK